MDEKTAADVSDGPAYSGSDGSRRRLLLLDSLLQEVCIESGSDGSLALSSLGLSVCLVSHNLLYSGLKKAHSKMKSMKKNKKTLYDFDVTSGAVALSVPPE